MTIDHHVGGNGAFAILRRVTEDSVALVAGIGAGAGLMYLFDPMLGRARRQQLRADAHRLIAHPATAPAKARLSLLGHFGVSRRSLV